MTAFYQFWINAEDSQGAGYLLVVASSGLASSKGAARRTVREGGASVNNAKVGTRVGRPRSLFCCRVAGRYSDEVGGIPLACGFGDHP